MDIESMIGIVIAIFAILLLILGLSEFWGSEWEDVASNIAPLIVAIMVFAIAVGGIMWRRR